MKKIAIVARKNLDSKSKVFKTLYDYLLKKGKDVYMEERVAKILKLKKYQLFEPGKTRVDLILAMGGDGTILRVMCQMEKCETRVMGINMGHLGFLSEIKPVQVSKTLDQIFGGHYTVDGRTMLKATIKRSDKTIQTFYALNEVAIAQATLCRLIKLKTKVDKKKLATFDADGLLVATPTGSTAYSLSAGGPIVHPSIQAFILTPICPHSFNQKPIVLPNDKIIEILVDSDYESMNMTVDGQLNVRVRHNDIIQIERGHEVEFVRLPSESYFSNLREKLGWGERA
jgi:NAD+ kinase